MKIHRSKRTLFLDNVKMRSELEMLIAKNTELAIDNERYKREIEAVNEKIKEHNNEQR